MSQEPPLPTRSDSLPDHSSSPSSSSEGPDLPPAIPPLPGTSSGIQLHSPASSSSSLKKMATSDQLHVDTGATQEFESKSHYKNGFKTFLEFYNNDQMYDVEIKVGSKSFRCHRIVLACVSNYFLTMFTSEMTESKQKEVTIHDIDETAMEKLVQYAYTSKLQLTIDNVQPLLYAASILQMEIVAKACCEFMKKHLHPTNCIGVHNFAQQHNRTELINMADEYILENFLDVVETEEFKHIPYELLDKLVSSQDLNVKNEMQVYEAVIMWMKQDVPNRRDHLAKLIAKVKLPLLNPDYLLQTVATEEMVRKDFVCRDFVDDAKAYQMSLASLVSDIKISDRTRPRKSYAGVLFCVGGRGASGDPFKSIECYDPRKNRWFQVSEMNCRRRHVGVCCTGGYLYAVGGHDGGKHLKSGELFDPTSNNWKAIRSMSTPRRGIALASLGGAIYAVGGLDDSTCYNLMERYDPSSDQWTLVANMNVPRGGVGVATLKNYIYAIGGNDGVASLELCERYDPLLNKWLHIAPMKRHRAGAGTAVLDGYLYVVGGFDDSSPLDSCERYDPYTNKWTEVASMSCCRGGVGIATLGGQIFAVGGHDGTNYLNSVEAYDPMTNSWNPVAEINQCRAGAGLAFCDCSTTLFQKHLEQATSQLQCY
ncbi:hypothetical protein FSP39_004167 [Pinctada imbricata]|uniref:BTB domain-containing protein n=1 Tax=Pinctada imbricata TaxID=66713 RepID=A0AA89C8D7_PINIB|nr:hypothetical protein FSP39_004167 [Pinctada imbricata]